MKNRIYLIYLDYYHLDVLFVQILARTLANTPRMEVLPPMCLIVHGSGERAERMLEAEGLFPERIHGVLQVRTPEEQRIVERATKEMNRRIVGILTDATVYAVGFQGYDRGLLRVNPEGGITGSEANWLVDLIKKRAVPVISSLVREGEEQDNVKEAGISDILNALTCLAATDEITITMFTRSNRPGIFSKGERLEKITLNAAGMSDDIPDFETVQSLVKRGKSVLITSVGALREEGGPSGTVIVT